MGTNYYFFTKDKEPCETYFSTTYELTDDPEFGYRIHIAKTSAGWLPLFQAHDRCHSVAEIKKIYDTGLFRVIDEYGDTYTWKEFTRSVLEHNGGVVGAVPRKEYVQDPYSVFYDKDMPDHTPVSHFEYGKGKYTDHFFKDADGYEFDKTPFL